MNEDVNLMVENVIKKKNSNDKCQCECKKPIKHHVCEKDYARNFSIYTCEYDKDCEIDEYSKDCTYIKNIVDYLVIT